MTLSPNTCAAKVRACGSASRGLGDARDDDLAAGRAEDDLVEAEARRLVLS
jgi:hypothetical protein